jgi:hypothetical protein
VAENLVLKRGGAQFEFNHGAFYALEPVLGLVAGAVFVGEGVFSFQPPGELEQKHLARVTKGQPRLEEPFREAVRSSPTPPSWISPRMRSLKQGTVDSKPAGVLNDFREDFRDTLHTNIEARVLAGLLSTEKSLFLADIRGQKHGKLLFSVDPMAGESVSVVHYNPPNVVETWTAFNPPGSPASDERALVHTTRVDLDTEVDKRGRLEGTALSEFSALDDGPRLVLVELAPTLRVSKVAWGDGTELKYIQEATDKDADLWVLLPKPLVQFRMLLYDYTRGDDSRFIAMMKEFVQTNAGKGASTADFKAVCDKHFGGDMGWFFEQWVYGTDIPKITIEYNIKDRPEGPVLAIDATQQNVPDGFRSVMPIMLCKK